MNETFQPEYSFNNFFGINLESSPNSTWEEDGYDVSSNDDCDTIRNFIKNDVSGITVYFDSIQAKVIGDKGTNFFFRGIYDEDNAFDVFFLIERDLVHNGNYTNIEAARDFRGKFDSLYDSIDWDINGVYIVLDRDINTEEMVLSLWTNFYNGDFLNNIKTQHENASIGLSDSNIESTDNTIIINVVPTLDAIQEVQNVIRATMNGGVGSLMVVNGDYVDEYKALDTEDFSEKFTFTCSSLDGKLTTNNIIVISIKDLLNLDDTEMILECYYVSTPLNPDEKEHEDSQTVYKMRYWIDSEMDFRTKTIKENVISFNVAGLSHRVNFEEIIEGMKIGTSLIIQPEPENEYDPNALAFVTEDGATIGYLPKKDQPFARLFFKYGKINCIVSDNDGQWIETTFTPTEDMICENVVDDIDMRFEKCIYTRNENGKIDESNRQISFEEFRDVINCNIK